MNHADLAQQRELEDWERNQQRPAAPDPAQWAQLSAKWCDACGERIPDPRRQAIVGVRFCVDCQARSELKKKQGVA